jgi:hypothetical protein
MVEWKLKYLKYKLKFEKLNAKQKAGVCKRQSSHKPIHQQPMTIAMHPIAIEDFKNRLNGTPLENYIEIIYNLYLVKKQIRKAFLLELSNIDYIGIENVDIIIKTSYPEFEYTNELLIEGKPHRILIHNPNLSQTDLPREDRLIQVENDLLIATLLDFDCKGIPDDSNISYTLHINVNDKSVISYICDEQDKFNIEKITNYSKAAEELGYSFNYNIDTNLPPIYVIDKLITYMQTDDESNLHELHDDILNIVDNAFLRVLLEDMRIDKNTLDLDFIKENKYLVSFIFYMEKFEVFHILYPLTVEQVGKIDDIVLNYEGEFLNKNKQGFLDFINRFVDIFLRETMDINFDVDTFIDNYYVGVDEFVQIIDIL